VPAGVGSAGVRGKSENKNLELKTQNPLIPPFLKVEQRVYDRLQLNFDALTCLPAGTLTLYQKLRT